MRLNVVILNVMKYQDKKTNKDKIRIGYFCNGQDAIEIGNKFKGVSELSIYSDDITWFDKITKDMILNSVVMEFEEKRYPNNPLKSYLTLKNIEMSK